MEKVIIESFTLDHTKVKAPYVRLIGQETGEHGDIVSNFDIRLCQPNQQEIPTGGMHTLEHLLALYLRPRIKGYLDCSPFGCRTGFHLLCWGVHDPKDVAKALKEALELVVETTWDQVPGTKEKECGNYKDHSLFCAQEWAKEIPEDVQERVFERFYRVEGSRSKQSGGSGLGLSIVKHIVEQHRGKIRLTSRVNEGTSIEVQLPRA